MATRRYGMDIVLSQKEGASEGDTGTGYWEPKLLRHGPSRGAGAEAGPKKRGGDFLGQGSGLCGLCWSLPGSRFSPSKQDRGPSLEQPVASPGHFAGGRFLGRATRSVKGGPGMLEGREGSGTGGMAKDFSTFPTTSRQTPFPAFPPSTEWLRFFLCRRYGVSSSTA